MTLIETSDARALTSWSALLFVKVNGYWRDSSMT